MVEAEFSNPWCR